MLVIKMEKVKRKRRIRIGRLMLLIVGILLCALLLIGGVFAIKNLFKKDIIAAEFANAKTELKLEDDSINNQVYEEKDPDSDEMLIYALHLPTFSNSDAQQKLDAFVEEIKNEKARVTHIDYESNSAFSQYKSYVITATTYADLDGLNPINPQTTKQLYISFDQDKMIDIEDCIRMKAIRQQAKDHSCETENVLLKKITEEGLVLNVNGEDVDFGYDENNTSFVMDNQNIPSILKYDKIEVEKREIDPNKPMIAFTFDDGPAPGNTERILAALEKVGGRATFFELGYLMETYPDTVRAIVESGSEVASHSYDHTYDWMNGMSLETAVADLDKVDDIFFSLTGQDISLFRPPFGASIKSLSDTITEKIVYWDVDTRDWESKNTEKVIEMCKKYTYNGAIVLFHDIHATTIPAVEQLIEYYDSQGYQFVTVSELYEAKGK